MQASFANFLRWLHLNNLAYFCKSNRNRRSTNFLSVKVRWHNNFYFNKELWTKKNREIKITTHWKHKSEVKASHNPFLSQIFQVKIERNRAHDVQVIYTQQLSPLMSLLYGHNFVSLSMASNSLEKCFKRLGSICLICFTFKMSGTRTLVLQKPVTLKNQSCEPNQSAQERSSMIGYW